MGISRRTALKGLLTGGALAAGTARAEAALPPKQPQADAIGLLYDSTMCVGCRACVSACREANGLTPQPTMLNGVAYDAPSDLDAHTKTIIRLYDAGGVRGYVKNQCMHCVDPACVSVCMFSALHKTRGGIVAYDPDSCIGCRYCQVACPFNVPKFEWASATPKIVKCELCGDRLEAGREPACAEVCPRQAVIFGKRADLLREAHARIDAAPKRYVPTVYGEHEAGGTQVLYLSGVSFAALGLPTLGEQAIPYFTENLQHAIYQGFIAPVALYGALAIVMFRNRKHNDEAGTKDAGELGDREKETTP
jgi:Fe-S-cluster-containing dehydrogenase component